MRTLSTLAFLATAFLPLTPTFAERPPDTIYVSDEAESSWEYQLEEHEFKRQGDVYVHLDQRIPVQQIEELRQQILAAPKDKSKLLSSLGITPEKVAAKRHSIFAAALPEHWRNKDGSLPPFPQSFEKELSHEKLAPFLLEMIAGGDKLASSTDIELSVTLPGTPTIKLQSLAERPGLLPFTVTSNDKQWRIYDPTIAKQLQILLPESSPNYYLLDAKKYWENLGAEDPEVSWLYRDIVDKHFSKKAYQRANGYANSQDLFKVKDTNSGWINGEPLSIHFDILVPQHKSIAEIWWWMHLTDKGEPKNSWLDLIKIYEEADEVAAKQPWLKTWLKGNKNRRLELIVAGTTPNFGNHMKEKGEPNWKKANLHGEPKFAIFLREGGSVRGTAYFNGDSPHMLITDLKFVDSTTPGKPKREGNATLSPNGTLQWLVHAKAQ